jgi:hypothetical protein
LDVLVLVLVLEEEEEEEEEIWVIGRACACLLGAGSDRCCRALDDSKRRVGL